MSIVKSINQGFVDFESGIGSNSGSIQILLEVIMFVKKFLLNSAG